MSGKRRKRRRKENTHKRGDLVVQQCAATDDQLKDSFSFGMELHLLFVVNGGEGGFSGFEVSNGGTQLLQPELTSRGSNQCIYQNSYFLSSNLIPVFDSLVFFFPCVSNHTGTNPVSMIFFSNWFCAFFFFVFGLLCVYLKTIYI